MVKIYTAENFLEAEKVFSQLQTQEIEAENCARNQINITTGKTDEVYDIYVSETEADKAKKIVEKMSFADCRYVSRRAPIFLRIYAVIMLVVIVLVLLLQFIV